MNKSILAAGVMAGALLSLPVMAQMSSSSNNNSSYGYSSQASTQDQYSSLSTGVDTTVQQNSTAQTDLNTSSNNGTTSSTTQNQLNTNGNVGVGGVNASASGNGSSRQPAGLPRTGGGGMAR